MNTPTLKAPGATPSAQAVQCVAPFVESLSANLSS